MKWIVIGGGVSGMSACWYLKKMGHDVLLIEQQNQLGGRLGAGNLDNQAIQFGGKNIGRKYTEFRKFCREFSDPSFEYFGINSSRVENGRFITIDRKKPFKTFANMLATNSPLDLMRLAILARHVKQVEADGFIDSIYFDRLARKHGYGHLGQLFGARLQQNIIRPMVVRMNGAEADEAAICNFGSNLRVLLDTYDQLIPGIQPVLDAFMNQVSVRLNTTVDRIQFDQNKRFQAVSLVSNHHQPEIIEADGVILATPATGAAKLLKQAAPVLARLLDSVKYNCVKVIVAKYHRDIFTPSVRAVVFDENHILSNAGVYGIHDLDTIRFTFSGKRARTFLKSNPSDHNLLDLAESILNQHIPITRQDRIAFTARQFNEGLCSFTANHQAFLQSLKKLSREYTGFHLTGDYFKGASIEACFRSSKQCIEQLSNLTEQSK